MGNSCAESQPRPSRPPNQTYRNEHGYLGDSHQTLRTREVFKYYQPTDEQLREIGSDDGSEESQTENQTCPEHHPRPAPEALIASYDPVLTCFTNLTARMLDCRRCMIVLVAGEHNYVVSESTQTLSVEVPHTYRGRGDELWLGAGSVLPSAGSLCEHAVSLLPPSPEDDQPFLLQITDLSKTPRWSNADFVQNWPWQRFYCAVPLRTMNGVSIGTLCVWDEKPRPCGFNEEQKMTLANMGDNVMNYLQTKQGNRDLRKAKVMDAGLSRFISGSLLEKDEMTEWRDGRLWSENILRQKRAKEIERKKKAEERRIIFQQEKYVKMLEERKSIPAPETAGIERCRARCIRSARCRDRRPEKLDHGPSQGASSLATFQGLPLLRVDGAPPPPEVEDSDTRWRISPGLEGVTIEDPENEEPGLSASKAPLSPSDSSSSNENHDGEAEPAPPNAAIAPSIYPQQPPIHPSPASSVCSFHRRDRILLTPPSPKPLSVTPQGDYFTCSPGFPVRSSDDTSDERAVRKSPYEKTATIEPHFRDIFSRAAILIQTALEADVLFLDTDLEGGFDHGECKCENCGLAYISTDKEAEAAVRADRPKECRRQRGILGYATTGGSSSQRGVTGMPMGLDVSELDESTLNRLVEDNRQGRIVAQVDADGTDQGDGDYGARFMVSVLRRFLPGAKSVILMPLYDHNHEPFAVCFAWTRSATRTFCGDVEGSFVAAVANTIMTETARLHIINADKAKGEFISCVSHELRSPLHGILASGNLLTETNLDTYQRPLVEAVISCGMTLLDTVSQMLDFQNLNTNAPLDEKSGDKYERNDVLDSGPQLGREAVGIHNQLADIDVGVLLEEIVDGACMGAEFHGTAARLKGSGNHNPASGSNVGKVTVIIDIDQRAEGWIFHTQPAALKRIVNNLVGNAIKYTERGWVHIWLTALEGSWIKFSIADSGRGISRSFLKTKLFTPFSQENPLATGAGLGMSIVRQIIRVIGGKVDVQSQVGKGTVVTVQVPMAPANSPGHRDEIFNVSVRTAGIKIQMLGFDRYATSESSPTRDAETFLRNSVERYARDFFGMEVLIRGSGQPEIVICNELSKDIDTAAVAMVPFILLFSHPPVDGAASRLPGRFSTVVRKPCGPKKLARALKLCLEVIQKSASAVREVAGDRENHQYPSTTPGQPSFPKHASRAPSDVRPPYSPELKAVLGAHNSMTSYHCTTENSPPNLPSPSPAPHQKKPTVLAVDDNRINLMLLTTYLTKKGYDFDTASDGLQALNKVRQKDGGYDVILMDLQMPVMSGIESTREIRLYEEERYAGRKRSFVVALTGLAAVGDQNEAFIAGVDAFMVKPVNFKALQKTMEKGLLGVEG